MLTWNAFATAEPELASACRSMIYQFGVGLAFLATVRPDGGPRVHPMCPVDRESELFAFLIPSPKRDDLHRDGRYEMHSFPADENEDAFYLAGIAELVDDQDRRRALQVQFFDERELREPPTGLDEQELFAFEIEGCLYTTARHGDPAPRHRICGRHDPPPDPFRRLLGELPILDVAEAPEVLPPSRRPRCRSLARVGG